MNQKKNTILIIEDEPPIRKLLTITLEGNGAGAGCERLHHQTVQPGSVAGTYPCEPA